MKRIVTALTILTCLVAAGTRVRAASVAFVKYEGVEGEAVDMDHKGWIELESFSHSVRQTGEVAGTGGGRSTDDAVPTDITVVKEVDTASPKLAEAVCKGKVFPKVEIHLTASYSDAGSVRDYTYELRNVRLTSYKVEAKAAPDEQVPMETITLNFEEVKATYTPAKSKGKGKTGGKWNVEQEKE